jgi:hypothetical protein
MKEFSIEYRDKFHEYAAMNINIDVDNEDGAYEWLRYNYPNYKLCSVKKIW